MTILFSIEDWTKWCSLALNFRWTPNWFRSRGEEQEQGEKRIIHRFIRQSSLLFLVLFLNNWRNKKSYRSSSNNLDCLGEFSTLMSRDRPIRNWTDFKVFLITIDVQLWTEENRTQSIIVQDYLFRLKVLFVKTLDHYRYGRKCSHELLLSSIGSFLFFSLIKKSIWSKKKKPPIITLICRKMRRNILRNH